MGDNVEGYIVSYTINDVPISMEELSNLQLHNSTMQAIYDTVNARIAKMNSLDTNNHCDNS